MSSHVRPRLYKTSEAAEILRMSVWSLGGLCRSGEIRASLVAGRWLISAEAIDDYLRAQERPTGDADTPPLATATRRRKRRVT
jgi:helix-turn-helix protein